MPLLTPELVKRLTLYGVGRSELRLDTWGGPDATGSATLHALLESGKSTPITQGTLSTDRSLTRSTVPITLPIYSLDLNVSDALRRGDLYTRCALLIDGREVGDYWMAYKSRGDGLGWPPGIFESSVNGRGKLRSVAMSNPVIGAEISETVPTNAYWEILTVTTGTLVASATAGTREPSWIIDDGTNELIRFNSGQTVAAGGTSDPFIITQTQIRGAIDRLRTNAAAPVRSLYGGIPMFQAYRLRTVTNNLDTNATTGDNWGAGRMWVMEWIEE